MNILFYNLDRRGGIEFIGDVFIDIFSHIDNITNIYIYKSQDINLLSSPIEWLYNTGTKLDLIVLNDLSSYHIRSKITSKAVELDIPTLLFLHGTNSETFDDVTLVANLNWYGRGVLNSGYQFPMRFIHGNIWKRSVRERNRNFIYFGRTNPSKFPKFLYEFLKEDNVEIDIYTNSNWPYQYSSNINVRSGYDISDISRILQHYKYFIMGSTTESLSLSLREAVLSGVVPIIYDPINYTFGNVYTPYVYRQEDQFLKAIDVLKNTYDSSIVESVYEFNKNLYRFEYTLFDLLLILRSMFKKTFSYIKTNREKIVKNITRDVIPQYQIRNNGMLYVGETIIWEKIYI